MARKNKGKFGKGKPAIEEQDEFVSGVAKVAERLRPYAMRIAVLITVVTIGIVSFTTYRWWQERKAKRATAIYVEALDIARRDIVPADAEPPDPDGKEEPVAEEDKPVTYETAEARAEAKLEALKRLRSGYGGTGVVSESSLLEASTLAEVGQYDEALAKYKSYASEGGSAMLRAIAREGIGYVLEAKALTAEDAGAREAGLREALAAFQAVQPKEDGPRRDYALYHEGRILATLNERDRAVEAFEKVLAIEPASPLTDDVNARLAALQVVPSK